MKPPLIEQALQIPPGRELDMLVAEVVFDRDPMLARRGLINPQTGKEEPQYHWGYPDGHGFAPPYSMELEASFLVSEAITKSEWKRGPSGMMDGKLYITLIKPWCTLRLFSCDSHPYASQCRFAIAAAIMDGKGKFEL
jgi:hypothetical protein